MARPIERVYEFILVGGESGRTYQEIVYSFSFKESAIQKYLDQLLANKQIGYVQRYSVSSIGEPVIIHAFKVLGEIK